MAFFDVCNGDADGLCALQQLRLAQPVEAKLITGAKRDNALVEKVGAAPGDRVTVLDLPLSVNRAALDRLLAAGVHVLYVDHHDCDDAPAHPALDLTLDTDPDVCTSLLMDRRLAGAQRPWALVGAFGDNLRTVARQLGRGLGYDEDQLDTLQELGEALNANAYGGDDSELLVPPAALARVMRRYADPLEFCAGEPVFARMRDGQRDDLARGLAIVPALDRGRALALALPDAPWSRRVMGALANRLVVMHPDRAHAVIVPNGDGLRASIRVPAGIAVSAASFCRRFGGGGRAIAAGVDRLAPERMSELLQTFERTYA